MPDALDLHQHSVVYETKLSTFLRFLERLEVCDGTIKYARCNYCYYLTHIKGPTFPATAILK